EEDLHRVLWRGWPLRHWRLGLHAHRDSVLAEELARRDTRGPYVLLVPIVAESEAYWLLTRCEGQLLCILRRDEQGHGRHFDRLVVLLLDGRAGRQDLDVLEDQLAALVAAAVRAPGDEHVDAAVRGDEPAHARHLVDLDRHATHAVRDQVGKEAGAASRHDLRLGDGVILLDRHLRNGAHGQVGLTEGAVGLYVDRPLGQPNLPGIDDRADADLLIRDQHVGRRPLGGATGLLDCRLLDQQAAVDNRGAQRAEHDREEQYASRPSHDSSLPSSASATGGVQLTLLVAVRGRSIHGQGTAGNQTRDRTDRSGDGDLDQRFPATRIERLVDPGRLEPPSVGGDRRPENVVEVVPDLRAAGGRETARGGIAVR